MKVLITGSTGYLGHQLALALAKQNIVCHALVRNINSNSIPKHHNIIPFKGDICDEASIGVAIQGCEYVFHSAAFTDLKCRNFENFYNVNVKGTSNLLKASLRYNIKKFIYTSTLAVYGSSLMNVPIDESQPRLSSYKNDYELTKSMSEELISNFNKEGLSTVILNVSRIYGPGLNTFSNGVNRLIDKISNNRFLLVPEKLDVVANYVFIDDVIEAHISAMKISTKAENFIIGGTNISYDRLFRRIKFLTRSKVSFIKLNYSVLKVLLRLYKNVLGIIGFQPLLTPSLLDSLFTFRESSSNKAECILRYKPTPLNIGLLRTVKFLNF